MSDLQEEFWISVTSHFTVGVVSLWAGIQLGCYFLACT